MKWLIYVWEESLGPGPATSQARGASLYNRRLQRKFEVPAAHTRAASTTSAHLPSMPSRYLLLLSLCVACSDAVLLSPLRSSHPTRCASAHMESEMAYRKRMAESKDPSKPAEWNKAYSDLEKCCPKLVMGRLIGGNPEPDAIRAALQRAREVDLTDAELEPFEKVLDKIIENQQAADAQAKSMTAFVTGGEESDDSPSKKEQRKASEKTLAMNQARKDAYQAMQAQMPAE